MYSVDSFHTHGRGNEIKTVVYAKCVLLKTNHNNLILSQNMPHVNFNLSIFGTLKDCLSKSLKQLFSGMGDNSVFFYS